MHALPAAQLLHFGTIVLNGLHSLLTVRAKDNGRRVDDYFLRYLWFNDFRHFATLKLLLPLYRLEIPVASHFPGHELMLDRAFARQGVRCTFVHKVRM